VRAARVDVLVEAEDVGGGQVKKMDFIAPSAARDWSAGEALADVVPPR
jgi:hypothetical protein